MDSYYYNAHPSSYSNYSYHPPPSHQLPNPSSHLTRHEIVPPPNTTIHLPGVDSYASLNSYHLPTSHVGGYEAQSSLAYGHHHQSSQGAALPTTSYYQEPSVLQSLAAKEAVRHYAASLPHGGYASSLETKRKKVLEGGAAGDSLMVCTICNVVCNSQVVFNDHLAGRKHAVQAGTIPPNSVVHANPMPNSWTNSVVQSPLTKAKRKILKKPKIVQSAWCEICSIDCTSEDVLNKHKSGKKHKKQLEKLNGATRLPNTPASTSQVTNPIIGPQSNPATTSATTAANQKAKRRAAAAAVEDVETKRNKLLTGGTAVEAVRVCEICNVVCNSQTVFNFHLAGQKHASLVKKLAEPSGTTTTTGPQVVNLE